MMFLSDVPAPAEEAPPGPGTDGDAGMRPGGKIRISLPYADSAAAIILTVIINVGVLFLFFWPNGVTFGDILMDSFICVVITAVIDTAIVYPKMKKMRKEKRMPPHVPMSPVMQKLPKNPAALLLIYIALFAPLAVGANAVILWFYGMDEMTFVPWMVYKIFFALIVSIIISEYLVFRYVQPDWAGTGNTGGHGIHAKVKNPLPKVSVLREMYGSVTGYIAINLVRGVIMGTVVFTAENSVVIDPVTADLMLLRGLTLGLMIGFLVTNGVINKMNRAIRETGVKMMETASSDRAFSWMPVKRVPFFLLMCALLGIFSSLALWSAMVIFGMEEMNFFQFILFISVYAIVISRPLSNVLTRRCMQADYIRYILNKKRTGVLCRLLERYI